MTAAPRKRRRPVAEINVVPYIDVMLVLLIIFMVTAPLITQGVKVNLPKQSSQPLPPDSKPAAVISITADGQYFLQVGSKKAEHYDDVSTVAAVVKAQREVEPATPVVIRGDGAVPYAKVVQLMGTLQGAGVDDVGLMTDPPEEKK
ncbi:protein TolR [Gallaecimonas kandeliae]|uniref:protein TolR n=1 Tax=Gallaecimonas kandeliae TaxID=3029055 RepID=UPI002649AD69|nr:protein TolR [Gallaecimonas kandeliae]WKE64472.1 protein TolR [Gallaecimonas kandeliae]